jgi:hypothetical protein
MRRWVCIIALLAGFGPGEQGWHARTRQPVPIERRLDGDRGMRGVPTTVDWWLRP